MPATTERPRAGRFVAPPGKGMRLGRRKLRQPEPGRHIKLDFPLHPMQRVAIHSVATEILYGGAAGGGKSHLMRVAAILWCLQIPGLQCYLYRRSFEELTSNHMMGTTGFPALLEGLVEDGYARITQKRITFYNGATIILSHLQYTKNLSKSQGKDIHVLLMDELTHFTEEEYTYLRGRCRMPETMKAKLVATPLEGQFPRLLSGTNPGGIGHHWVKRYFIQREGREPFKPLALYNYKGVKKSGGKIRQFIPARLEDNPTLDPEEYGAALEGMGDPLLVRALRMGDWNIVAGSMFGETWMKTRNGLPWHEHPGFPIPLGWKIWRGGDDGYENEAACVWVTEDPRYKTLYVIDEIYMSGLLADDYARRVLERDREIPMQDLSTSPPTKGLYNIEALRGAMDTSAFGDIGGGTQQQKTITRGEQMNKMGCRWERVEKWPGSRVAGIQNFHRLMKPNANAPALNDHEGKPILGPNGKPQPSRPGIVFFKKCFHTIRTITALVRSKRDVEDIDDSSEDHAFDATRYAIQYKRGKTKRVALGGI